MKLNVNLAIALGLLGVADGPGKPLDQLRRGVIGTEMHGVDVLVEQHGSVRGERWRSPRTGFWGRGSDVT
jgi:hypothetical protein